MHERETTGLHEFVEKHQDMLDPKAWGALTAAGPMISGIAWAFWRFLGVPAGWSMLGAALIFSTLVGASRWHGGKFMAAMVSLMGACILFWQAALVSTAGVASGIVPGDVEEIDTTMGCRIPLNPIDFFVSPAYAGETESVEAYTVQRKGGTYYVGRGPSRWKVPVDVYRAIDDWERSRKREKGFGVRW